MQFCNHHVKRALYPDHYWHLHATVVKWLSDSARLILRDWLASMKSCDKGPAGNGW